VTAGGRGTTGGGRPRRGRWGLRAAARGCPGSVRRRAGVLNIWVGVALLVLALRLADLQLVRGPLLTRAEEGESIQQVVVPALRGEIIDRHGSVLALSEPAAMVWADPRQVADKPAAAAALARLLPVSQAAVLQLLEIPGRQYVVLTRNATAAEGQAVQKLGLAGVYVQPTTVRVYPKGFFLGHVLGFVGANGQGLDGVEYTYNKQLAGRPGEDREWVSAWGTPLPLPPISVRPVVPGLTLELTIDDGLQRDLQEQIEAALAATHASAAYGIVMRPSDGAILAATSWPTFDPNHYSDVPPSVWDNTVWGTDLVPGSVFKPITTSAALETGVVTPSTPFFDPGFITVDGVTLHNFTQLEQHTTFARALDESANVVFAHVGLRIGLSRFYQYLHAFGLFGLTGVDVPGEQLDVIRPENLATPLTLAEESFGESLEVTPLSLIDALAVVANGGLLVQPHFARALLTPTGRVVWRYPTHVVRRVISPQVAATIRQLMMGVINDGTGSRGFIPCYDAAGKTGTSNIYAHGRTTNHFIASFVEYAPASHPAAIVLIQLVNPQGWFNIPWFNEGGEVAAPVAQAVLADTLHVLGVPPHCTATNATAPLPGAPGTTALVLDMVQMPALVNLTPAQARIAAADAGLSLSVSGHGPRILRQDPPPGASVQKWTTVFGFTSSQSLLPPSFVRVPDVRGDTVAQATAALAAAGLGIDVHGVGVAQAEDPAAGDLAAPGSGVSVTFGGT
jgi:stage V sporulation protein D (sporulation-specific penicillin-binding protein)